VGKGTGSFLSEEEIAKILRSNNVFSFKVEGISEINLVAIPLEELLLDIRKSVFIFSPRWPLEGLQRNVFKPGLARSAKACLRVVDDSHKGVLIGHKMALTAEDQTQLVLEMVDPGILKMILQLDCVEFPKKPFERIVLWKAVEYVHALLSVVDESGAGIIEFQDLRPVPLKAGEDHFCSGL
jgi:hypothetical protein